MDVRLSCREVGVVPGAREEEAGLAILELLRGVMATGGQRLGLHRGVVDGQVVQLLVVLDIGALDGGGALVPTAVIALLVEVVEVGKVSGHAPAGRVVHVGGNKGIKAQLAGAAVNVGSHGLEACEVLDVGDVVAGLCDEVGVGDDAVALVAVAHGDELAALVIQVVGIGVELRLDGRALEVQCEVAPLLDAGGIADDEHGRSWARCPWPPCTCP